MRNTSPMTTNALPAPPTELWGRGLRGKRAKGKFNRLRARSGRSKRRLARANPARCCCLTKCESLARPRVSARMYAIARKVGVANSARERGWTQAGQTVTKHRAD